MDEAYERKLDAQAREDIRRIHAMSCTWGDPAGIEQQPGDSLVVKRVRTLLWLYHKAAGTGDNRISMDARMMPPAPFTSDGCSGGMTWLWRLVSRRAPPWHALCVEHDRAYWAGGSAEMRAQADRALMAGVVLNGHPVWAFLMWVGVRLGGHPLLPTPWRWGYGHRYPRGYSPTGGV